MVKNEFGISGGSHERIKASLPIGDEPPKVPSTTPMATRVLDRKADELSEAIHSKFMELLSDKVAEKDGHLTAQDLQEMSDDFRRNMDDIKTVFMEAVESFTRAQARSRDDSERKNVFARLMVQKFAHQLVDDRELKRHPERLSRRMLPGFMNALYTMVGTQKQVDFEKQTKAIIHTARTDGNGEVDWEDVYRTPGARMIMLGAEIEMAQHFSAADKRIEWLMAMINSNLIPGQAGLPGADWEMTREAAVRLLGDVFSDLRAALRDSRTREKIRSKLGYDMIVLLDDVATRFT